MRPAAAANSGVAAERAGSAPAAATGSSIASFASPGMQTSLQTSHCAAASKRARGPARPAGTSTENGSTTSPS